MYKRIILYPDLSHALGNDDGKAEILQQVYYWTSLYSKNPEKYKNHFQDSAWWVYNSYPAWKENDFPNMSVKSIERKFVALREQGYLIRSTKNFNKIKFGKGKAKGENINDVSWYRLNFEKLHADIPMTKEIFPNINGQSDVTSTDNLSVGYGQSDVTSTDNLSVGYGQSDVTNTLEYPYTSTENKTNTSPYTENSDKEEGKNYSDKKKVETLSLQTAKEIFETAGYYSEISPKRKKLFLNFIERYFSEYEKRKGEKHPNVPIKRMLKGIENIRLVGIHEHPELIETYFNTEYKPKSNPDNLKYGKGLRECDYRWDHFITVLKGLMNTLEEKDYTSANKPETVQADNEWYGNGDSKTYSKPKTVQYAEMDTFYCEPVQEEEPLPFT